FQAEDGIRYFYVTGVQTCALPILAQTLAEKFLNESSVKSFDLRHREIIANNMSKYNSAFEKGKTKFHDLSNSKIEANLIKWKVMENLDRYLVEFETNFTSRGGKV